MRKGELKRRNLISDVYRCSVLKKTTNNSCMPSSVTLRRRARRAIRTREENEVLSNGSSIPNGRKRRILPTMFSRAMDSVGLPVAYFAIVEKGR